MHRDLVVSDAFLRPNPRLFHAKGSREALPRKIHPLGLLSRGPVLYLVCTLFDYEDVLQLALHRFSAPQETNEPARPPKDFDFQRYVNESASKYGSTGKIRLVAHFNAAAAEHLRETPLSADQTWRELENGKVEVTAAVEDDMTLRWRLLGFGSRVEVVAPEPLRRDLAEEHAVSCANYSTK
jgi:predicted DNA-binding transcriptional regulator YafY